MRGVKPITSALFLFCTLMLPGGVRGNAWAQQNPLPAPHPRMLLSGASAPPGLNALGRLPAGQRLNLAITLRLRNQEELRGLLQDIYKPASAHYRQYLSVEEFTERFGPTAEDHERVLEFARSSGLAVTHTSANRLVVDVNGAVEDIERIFGVRMHVYRHPVEARTFYAPDVEPSVDASLPIQGVAGLSTLNLPHPASPRPVLSPNPQIQSGGTAVNGGFTASDLRAAYIPGVTLTGAGQSVGLFEMNGYNITDIQTYFSSLGESLSVPILTVLVDGVSGTCGVSCDDGEQALDIEMALALAPDLSAVIVYEGESPTDILNQMATDSLAKQLSCSYVFTPDPSDDEPIFLEFAAQGQSFFASSGDGGAYSPPDCVSNCWTSRFPADDPYVTAVGGTLLGTNGPGGAWLFETTWASSGGGINSYGYPIASYQAPLINVLNQGSSTLRNIPDVAAVASNVYAEANGSAGSSGGTSASAPLWASFTALVNQQASGAPVGFLNPIIYPLAQTAGYGNDFHDITSGNNFDSYSPDLFSAVTGYDLATGLGSPNGQDLINALAPINTGANFTLLSSSPTLMVAQGAQGTAQITLQAVNGFNGTVNLGYMLVGQPTGLAASLSPSSLSGAADSTLTVSASTATSSPSAMVAITGKSGGLTQSLYIPVTLLLPNLVETAVTAPPVSVTPGAKFSVTDTVQNTGQAAAGSSITGYYLSDAPSKNSLAFPLGSRTVPALAVAATSSAAVTVTVPGGIWPNTPYYLLACANDTNSVAEATSGNCLASSTTTIFNLAKTATTTSLTLTSSGAPATSVASGAVVTLTASVVAGSTPVHPGQVNFCDATPAHCTDIHLLETAQLTSGGTATLRFIPGIGSHSYQAVFAGTTGYTASNSGNASLQVTGAHPTTTTVAESGSAGNYSLSAMVTGVGGLVSPGGTLSFLDTSNSNASLGGVTLAAGTPSLGWVISQSPATGANPQGVAAADFNGDGIPDFAVTNRNDCSVTIFLGNRDGTFRQAAVIPNIYYAQTIAVADFNGDGIPDLVVGNTAWGSVTILLGNGNGTFNQVSAFSTGVMPGALAVADLNGDGIPDLAVGDYAQYDLSVFLGKGDGTFTAAPVVQLPGAAQGVAAGDFNRDGRMDLAVAVGNPANSVVEVLLGNGDGTFTPSGSTQSVGYYPSAIVSADFDGDGIPDLAVTITGSNNLAVFLGNGDGTFRPAAASPETGDDPLSLVAADFNGDGIPDLAVGNYSLSPLTILIGNGDGTFTAASTNMAAGNSPMSIAAADFNGDGLPDLATANSTDNTASVFLTQLTWTATAAVNGVNPSGAGSHLVDASYDGDANYSASVSTTVTLLTGVNPVPGITNLSPASAMAGAAGQTLTINGTNFVSTSTVTYNGAARAATFVSPTQVTITLSTSDQATAGSYPIEVSNPAPGGGASSAVNFTVLGPAVSLTPASLTFASQLSGTTSTAQPVTLTNTGNAALSITSMAASGDFAETNTCGTSLAAGSNCTINVTFKPTAGSARGGTLSVTDNAPGGVQTLPLAGTGEDFSLTLPSGSSSTSTVPPGQTANYSLSLGGLGGLTETINFTCSGAPSEATCLVNPASEAPGASGSVSLTVTVSTTAPGAAGGRLRPPPLAPGREITLLLLGLLAMAGLAAIISRLPLRRRRWALAWCGMGLFALAVASCGGGGGGVGGGVTTNPGTPAGTYTLVVTGTAAGAANLTHSMTLTLTVN